jgi:hypothetical protein
MRLAYNHFGVRSQTYIATNHGELAQGVAEDISNEYRHGEGESLIRLGVEI